MNSRSHQLILACDQSNAKNVVEIENKRGKNFAVLLFLVCEGAEEDEKQQGDGDRYSFQMLENKRHGSCFVV
ncbi:hypothetical protein HanIR_Chr04g0201111 [Helianthus annuus]|nr:hypothetical protein HanIR_Chr04g0201111 [Helianthus annuus]